MTALRWLWKAPAWLASAALVGGVRAYQRLLRPLLPPVCRFEPGCSEYMILAVRKYGPVVGAAKGVWRLCRCNPWGGWGHDPP
ncbi:MAG: membrane protein insertion efficiency factor YidD [Gemmataceae bacterium]|nr:membrane protein insertion efficiency factor YidD [Gemmataceae bacterium]